VRSLDIDDTKSASRGNDIYDDDSFSVAYSFALVTEGTLLGEYEDGRSDVVDVSSLSAPSTWNDSQTISSRDIENNMGRVHQKIMNMKNIIRMLFQSLLFFSHFHDRHLVSLHSIRPYLCLLI